MRQGALPTALAAAALAAAVLAAAGCGPARRPAPQQPGAQPARRPAPQRPAVPALGAPAAPPESPWFPPQDWQQRRDAEDFQIGPLDDGSVEPGARSRLVAVCAQLVKGTVDAAALEPLRAAGLSERLESQLESGGRPTEFRIGRLERISDGEVRARVRFWGERGSTEGEAFLVRLADGWFVSDLQIDLATQERRSDGGAFVPSPYRDRTH